MKAIDMSNFTTKFTASTVQEWVAQDIRLAIVQLIGGVNVSGDICQRQIELCLAGGMCVDCYYFPGNDGLPLSTSQRLNLVPTDARVQIRQFWTDIEPASTNASKNTINQSMSVVDDWAPWQSCGQYSALWVASKYGWLPWPWPGRKQWLVNSVGDNPNLGGGFSGTNNHVMTQYWLDAAVSGVTGVDVSLLAASEEQSVLSWLGGPMAITVGEGMANQMAAAGDKPLCDHVFYDQTDDDGKTYSVEKCLGSRGLYVSSNSSGEWVSTGPLGAA